MKPEDLLKTPQLFAVKKDGILQDIGGLCNDAQRIKAIYLLRAHKVVVNSDPAWQYEGYVSSGVPQRAVEQHYETMTVEEMAEMPVHKLAAPDCAFFMWTTSSHTPQAFWLARRWGFRYSSKAFTWVKLNKNAIADKKLCNDPSAYFFGMGHGTRRNTEDCYLFTRGAPKRIDAGVPELIVAPIREHSRNPDEAYRRIERLFAGPYCELFSRTDRAGWSSWGNEVGKFAP